VIFFSCAIAGAAHNSPKVATAIVNAPSPLINPLPDPLPIPLGLTSFSLFIADLVNRLGKRLAHGGDAIQMGRLDLA
jgi:hypothetical protein